MECAVSGEVPVGRDWNRDMKRGKDRGDTDGGESQRGSNLSTDCISVSTDARGEVT